MIQDVFVGLSLAVLAKIVVFGVGSEVVVPGSEVGEVALNVARGTAAPGGGEADVGGHCSGYWKQMKLAS